MSLVRFLSQSKIGLLHMLSMVESSEDVLYFVPDDENEPSFREYIRNLEEISSHEIRIIKKSVLNQCFLGDVQIIVEQRLIRDLRLHLRRHVALDLFIFAADAFLASAFLRGMPINPKGLEASFKFRRYFSQIKFDSVWLPETLYLSMTQFYRHQTAKFSALKFRSLCLRLILKIASEVEDSVIAQTLKSEFLVVGISTQNPIITRDYLEKLKLISNELPSPCPIILKFHPNFIQSPKVPDFDGIILDKSLQTYPLEIFLSSREGNSYLGDLTGGIVYSNPERVNFLYSNDGEMKNHSTYYKTFLKLWKNSPLWQRSTS